MSLSSLVQRANDAIRTNPSNADKSLTNGASNWLWAVFAIFAFTFLSWLIWSFILKAPGHSRANKHEGVGSTATTTTGSTHGGLNNGPSAERIFHYLWIVAAFAGMVAYFAMASNLGNTPIRQYLRHGSNPLQTRQVFYARYIYWFIAWPMVVIATLLLSGASWATILFGVAMQELWVVSWLCGALVRTKYKWGFYVFGIAAYCVLAAVLMLWGRKHATRFGTSAKNYTPLAGALVGIWLLYWIAWCLSEGGNYLSISGEHIFYGILDLISVPLLGFAFLALSQKWDHSALGLRYTQDGRYGGHGHNNYGHAGHSSLAEKGVLGTSGVHDGVQHDATTTHHHNNGLTGTSPTTGHGLNGHHDVPGTTTTGHHTNPLTGNVDHGVAGTGHHNHNTTTTTHV